MLKRLKKSFKNPLNKFKKKEFFEIFFNLLNLGRAYFLLARRLAIFLTKVFQNFQKTLTKNKFNKDLKFTQLLENVDIMSILKKCQHT